MNFKQILSFDNYFSANITLGMLMENDINCYLKDEYIVTIDPLLNPAVGGIKLMVAEGDFESAKRIMQEAEADYVKHIPCPRCKRLSLLVVEKTNNPETLWGKIKNQIAYGQTITYSKLYKCESCNSIFSALPSTF